MNRTDSGRWDGGPRNSRAARILGTLFTGIWLLYLIGPIVARTRTESYDGGRPQIGLLWAPVMSITRPQLAPNALQHTEWNLRALEGTRLGFADRMYVNLLLFAYVRGLASALEAETQAERDTGLTSDEWMETQDATLRSMLTSGALATFHRMAAEDGFDFDLDSLFEFGLERLLDGLEAFVGAQSSR